MNRSDDHRPDPESLLALSRGEGAGRLKVFVGAAPGVGKTFAMLAGARRLKAEGVDVVIGLVETHGRAETEALLEGLEVLPRRKTEYRGREIAEFDLDAALARTPELLIVDELAHTNAPESRHPKRWQDVEELLAAGCDVWTALNIQHLESLADIVSRITGVVVRETVPDRVLQRAADVVLVDITPDELIQRLREGKVYIPETARRATERFFTPGNLTALRELALRRTADRVDDQIADWLKQKAIEGPWGASERLLACVGPDDVSERVVRRAAQLATGLNAGWIALHVAVPGFNAEPAKAARLGALFGLVERLGGDPMRSEAHDYAAEILRVARRENVTQILVAQSPAPWWRRGLRRSTPQRLLSLAGVVEVHVVPAGDGAPASRRSSRATLAPGSLERDAMTAVAAVAVATGVGEALTALLLLPNLSIIFLAAVLFCALRRGTRAAMMASVASFLAYNFFFIEPLYTFTIAKPYELFALFVFLAVSALTGSLAGRMRDQGERMAKAAAATQSLYEFSRKLSGAWGVEEVLWAAAAHLHASFGGRVVLLLAEGDALHLKAAWPPDAALDDAAQAAARWALRHREPAGWGTGTLPKVAFQFRPILAARGAIAVCGVEPKAGKDAIAAEDERTLTAILDQTGIALDRAALAGEAVKAASLAENEKVRNVLLDSLSHDLRTPLASIAGSVSALRDLDDRLSSEQARDLVQSIDAETGRLTRFVANLIDMSRIEAGGVKVGRDWVDLADVVHGAAERSRKAFPDQPIRVSLAPDLPLVRGDARLLEQVLFNLLDNAQKYAGGGGVAIHGRREAGRIALSVTDEGPGIKPADLDRVFEKFYRGGRADGRKAGAGLGLSICKGLVEAMGGAIEVQSPAIRRRGTRVVIRLPVAAQVERPT